MPRRSRFTPEGGSVDDDIEKAAALRRHASGEVLIARRLLNWMKDYIDARPRETPQTLWEGFIGRLAGSVSGATLANYVGVMNSYGIHPSSLDLAAQRIGRRELLSGVDRFAREERIREWRVEMSDDVLVELVSRSFEGDKPVDLDYRSFLYVLVCTGGRPENVMGVHTIEVQARGLAVAWGRRKVRPPSRAKLLYSYAWSFRPPEDVRLRLSVLDEQAWCFASSSNIASAVNSWLRKRLKQLQIQIHVTSTTPRARLSTHLSAMVLSGSLRESRFEELLDHELSMSRGRYQAGVL